MPQLNERDFAVIDYLKNQGWALSSQIAARFFSGSRHTCSNRMRSLARAQIVEVVALSDFRKRYWHERAVLNAICVSSGRLRVYRLGQGFREAFGDTWARPAGDSMVAHQVLLASVQDRLEAAFPSATIITEGQEASRRAMSSSPVTATELPDLVLIFGGVRIAVELERKARRGLGNLNYSYENRFENLMRDFNAVLYVMEKEDQLSRLAEKAEGYRRVGFCSILSMHMVIRSNRPPIPLKIFISEFNKAVV